MKKINKKKVQFDNLCQFSGWLLDKKVISEGKFGRFYNDIFDGDILGDLPDRDADPVLIAGKTYSKFSVADYNGENEEVFYLPGTLEELWKQEEEEGDSFLLEIEVVR